MSLSRQVTTWRPAEVTALLRDRVDAKVTSAQWIGSGAWSDCFAFTHERRDLVIRIGRFGDDFLIDHYVGRYATAELPIPPTSLVGDIGDDFFAVSDFVPGQPLESVVERAGMTAAIARLLDALRITDPTDLPGWGRWTPTAGGEAASWREFLLAVDKDPPGTRVHGWKAKLATSSSATHAFKSGYALLQATIVDDVPRSLAHNDLLNRNVHVAQGGITGIFDWGNSLLGDHLYDLALFCFWEPWLPHVEAQPIVDAVRTRWSAHHGVLDDFDNRLRSCVVHTALEHIAYHGGQDHWDEVQRISDRMDAIASYRW